MENKNVHSQLNMKEQLLGVINNETTITFLADLNERWKDEKEYEDWSDYETSMKKNMDIKPFVFEKSTKRPFGFIASRNKRRFQFISKSSGTSCYVVVKEKK